MPKETFEAIKYVEKSTVIGNLKRYPVKSKNANYEN